MRAPGAINHTENVAQIGMAQPGNGEPICRVIAETWLDTYPNTEYGITEDMIRGNQYEPDGKTLRQDFIARTEDRISRNDTDVGIYVAHVDQEVIGVGAVKTLEDERRKITVLFVLPGFQGQRVGSRLLNELLEWNAGRDTYLKVAQYNQRAIDLYVKKGFEDLGPVDESDRTTFNNGVIMPEIGMVRRTS